MKQVFYQLRPNSKRWIRSIRAPGSILSTLPRADQLKSPTPLVLTSPTLRAPLDAEEMSRVTIEDEYTLIIVDVPITEERNNQTYYVTIPLLLSSRKRLLLPLVWEKLPLLDIFIHRRLRNFYTFMKSRFIFLQVLYHNAELYLTALRSIGPQE